jgi:hypothetical protein
MPLNGLQRLSMHVLHGKHAVNQVRPIETSHHHPRLVQPELIDDVLLHPLGRRRGERVKARIGKTRFQRGELTILLPKIVTPLTDAVGFVDGETAHLLPVEKIQKLSRQQPLRRDEQQPIRSILHASVNLVARLDAELAVYRRRRIATLLKAVHLVLHQRDQRRDHDIQPLGHQWRHLVAK